MAKSNKQELAVNVKKSEDISKWYQEVILKSDLIEYTDVAGCMVFRPNSYQIWENIQRFLDDRIKERGVRNAYFPLFIPEKLLTKEEDHVEGFSPEVAWVTHAGDSPLNEKLAVRPTSETIMYDSYSKWIKSYRDLPLLLNQWCNVVRWEFKHATPFLRNREFLWQEGHTAFETYDEAVEECHQALEDYRAVYEDLLAIPVELGRKSINEKFAGADFSLTAEPFSPVDGKSIQACTSHHLGQNFGKAFNIEFLDKNQKKQVPYQNSWGLSTRSIGAMIMIHGDDNGLVLPPRVATNKVVILPLLFKGKEEVVLNKANEIFESLKEFNPILDDDRKESSGFKMNKWELQGIPIRLELGPRDLENDEVVLVRRDTFEKVSVKISELNEKVSEMLENIHQNMFDRVKKAQEEVTLEVDNFEDMKKAISEGKRCLVPWKESEITEDEIKEETGAKTSCLPFRFKDKDLTGVKCFYSGEEATCYVYFSKSH